MPSRVSAITSQQQVVRESCVRSRRCDPEIRRCLFFLRCEREERERGRRGREGGEREEEVLGVEGEREGEGNKDRKEGEEGC